MKARGDKMKETINVNCLISSLIDSIDMYNYILKNHHRHTVSLAYQIGNSLDLDKKSLANLIIAASIHDIGALHIEEQSQLLEEDVLNPRPHEKTGVLMLDGFEGFNDISKIINHHHIRYDEFLEGKFDDEIPFECFVLNLADRIDVLYETTESKENIESIVIEKINSKFGTIFHPDLEEVFNKVTSTSLFWKNRDNDLMYNLIMDSLEVLEVGFGKDDIFAVARIFSRIVDYKSIWTSLHSHKVSLTAERIARLMGMSNDKIFELKLAGYLHDIGKIAIPSEILEKPGPLKDDEYLEMQTHATYSKMILSKIKCLGDIPRWASSHHERRDKTGYPLSISSDDFTIEMDVVAYADILVALLEDRPYRERLEREKVLEILKDESQNRLSNEVYEVVYQNIDELIYINS